ncbi:MAG: GntR family transcriptional regulator [Shimia sp.]
MTWQDVRDEVLRRIRARVWAPGDLIPTEAALAAELGCARATVNRALREIAATGLLDRRRKAGTRVALRPVAKAVFDIPVMREEVEASGRAYAHRRLSRAVRRAPAAMARAIGTHAGAEMLRLGALHLADGAPYALEDRWIALGTVPEARDEPFEAVSANEWLLRHAPYTHGEIAFGAVAADAGTARSLDCAEGAPLMSLDRVTWNGARPVTQVRILFHAGYALRTAL